MYLLLPFAYYYVDYMYYLQLLFALLLLRGGLRGISLADNVSTVTLLLCNSYRC
jgi:hypothetical protein